MVGMHKCPVCPATFTRQQHVARHMRSHTGDKPYKCLTCTKGFSRSDLLNRHTAHCASRIGRLGKGRKGKEKAKEAAAASSNSASASGSSPPSSPVAGPSSNVGASGGMANTSAGDSSAPFLTCTPSAPPGGGHPWSTIPPSTMSASTIPNYVVPSNVPASRSYVVPSSVPISRPMTRPSRAFTYSEYGPSTAPYYGLPYSAEPLAYTYVPATGAVTSHPSYQLTAISAPSQLAGSEPMMLSYSFPGRTDIELPSHSYSFSGSVGGSDGVVESPVVDSPSHFPVDFVALLAQSGGGHDVPPTYSPSGMAPLSSTSTLSTSSLSTPTPVGHVSPDVQRFEQLPSAWGSSSTEQISPEMQHSFESSLQHDAQQPQSLPPHLSPPPPPSHPHPEHHPQYPPYQLFPAFLDELTALLVDESGSPPPPRPGR